jgi:ElaB/YqjD/DUF883 family membrane-anchored ribosome-binding protein
MREAANEARDDVGRAASESAEDLQADLRALREDFRKLAEKVAGILGARGAAAWQQAKSGVDEAVSDFRERHADDDPVEALREVSQHVVGVIDESIKTRPYVTLALAAGVGFILGAALRR